MRRFERFREASGLSTKLPAEQVNTLVYCMGEEADDILTSLHLTEDENGSYEVVKQKFDTYFNGSKNVIFERARFNQRRQEADESVDEFVTALHRLVEHCDYGTLKDEMVRDRIVVGIRDEQLSERMQLDAHLTLKTAVDQTRQRETVRKQQSVVRKNPPDGDTRYSHGMVRVTPRDGADVDLVQQQSPDVATDVDGIQSRGDRGRMGMRRQRGSQRYNQQTCKRCGRESHAVEQCPARNVKCYKCAQTGHFAAVCMSNKIGAVCGVRDESGQVTAASDADYAFLGSIDGSELREFENWLITLKLGDTNIQFRIDTGADETVIPESVYSELPNVNRLREADKKLFGVGSKSMLAVVGMFSTDITGKTKTTTQNIYVVRGMHKSLLGKPAIDSLQLISRVESVEGGDSVGAVDYHTEYPELFDGLGRMEGRPYETALKDDVQPYAVHVPRRVALPLMDRTRQELDRMVKMGVIIRVEQPTDWCAPMVVVPKSEDSVRICVDLTKLNEGVRRERHDMPSVDYTLGQLAGAQIFSKLDANSGFWQVPLAEEFTLLTTFITPFGRFAFRRLPFGISSAPEHFQRRMQTILEGIDGVLCQMDDILVFGTSQVEHDKRLHEVMTRLKRAKMTLNNKKCQFSVHEVKFLGQIINSSGIRPDIEKLRAVMDMPEPTDVSGVRRFLGMVNQLGKFTPHLAEITKPMRDLLSKTNDWVWGHDQQRCFQALKDSLTSTPVLALYDAKRETTVSADASSFGLGAVILQRQPDGELRAVAYASRAMTGVEQRYAQIEKEALATTWACERYSDYILGKTFHIETDHKPLVSLFGQKTLDELPIRIQRFRMRLMRFRYTISHVPGKFLVTADTLSRAPVASTSNEKDTNFQEQCQAYVNAVMAALPITDQRLLEVKRAQSDAITCQRIEEYVTHGWPDRARLSPEEKLYSLVAAELSIEQGLLLKGARLVIPPALRQSMLTKIHTGHQGITKCRERAKQSVW